MSEHAGEPVTWRAITLAREAERAALALAAQERTRREQAEDALVVQAGRLDAALTTLRAARRECELLRKERDRLQSANTRLRWLCRISAPLRWLRRVA